ncbi:MAG: translocation/assembly module TamB [Chitinophagales bacterium]|nr:translocation/assembly module TamB [Chitinophagales bacterium]
MAKKIVKRVLLVGLLLALVTGAFFFALRYPSFQTFLAHKAASFLSSRLETNVSIEKVRISFFNRAEFDGFYMEDLTHDTMIYADNLSVRFKVFELLSKKIIVRDVILNNAKFHLHRDSTGEHMNLTDVFSKLSSGKKTDTAKTPLTWAIDIHKLKLTNADFRYRDEKSHTNVGVYVPVCEVDCKKLDLQQSLIAIRKVRIDSADVTIELTKRQLLPDTDTFGYIHFLANGPLIQFDELALTNSRFRLNDQNSDSILPFGMDFKHLDVTGINLFAEKGSIVKDTIFASVKMLSATERSGFTLKNLVTDARVSVHDITLQNLDVRTPYSRITNSLSFTYHHFRAFKDFMNGVTIQASLNKSEVSLRDLNYFVRTLHKVQHNRLMVTGNISGRVNSLRGRDIEIRTASSTLFRGNFSTRGLPNIYETSLNLKVSQLATTVADIRKIYPGLKIPENIEKLGIVTYSGTLDGFVTDFVSNGKLNTALGTATTDLNFKYDKQRNKSAYSGKLALNSFELGKFFDDEKNFGKVSLSAQVKGGGLTLESLKVDLLGNVSSIVLRGHEYRDVKVNGAVVRKSYTGKLFVRDEFLEMDFEGKIDLTEKTPEFNFTAAIHKAQLNKLNLTKNNLFVSADIKADFTGNKIDDLNGTVQINNVHLRRDTLDAYVNYFSVSANFIEEGKKQLMLKSEIAEGELTGYFTINELPKALINFAKHTFTRNYEDTTQTTPQNFRTDIRIFNPRTLPQIFVPSLEYIADIRLTGEFNSINNTLDLTTFVPRVKYGSFELKNLDIDAHAANTAIDLNTSIAKVFSNDSLMLDTAAFTAKTQPDGIVQFLALASDKNKFNYGKLYANLTPLKGKSVLRIEPSDIKLGNNYWKFNPNNAILIEGLKVTTNNLRFSTDDQTVYISSYLKNDTSTCVKITLDNTSISDFTGIFTSKIRELQGNVNGKLVVEDVFYKPGVFADLVVDEFKLGNELIGDVNIETKLDDVAKRINVLASIRSIYNNVEAKGYVSIDPKKPEINIDVDGKRLGVNFLNFSFFDKYVKDCRGYATVNAKVYGLPSKPLLKGEVILVDDTVTVSFLNTRFHVKNQRATLDEHGFNFGNDLTVYDEKNNLIKASGRINHESFKQFELDLAVNAYNAQFLNTTEKISPYFYGVAYGTGNITFKGPINTPKIEAYAKTGPGTWCRLPIKNTYETNKYSFYRFTSKDTVVAANPFTNNIKLKGVNFILKLDVTPDARMDIILDPVAGDILTGYGSGNLKIEIPQSGNTTMYGVYEIERGNYLFTLQSVVNKRFEINKGGTVNFTGDVYKAALNIDAIYELRSSLSALLTNAIGNDVSAGGQESQLASAAKSRVPIQLLLKLTGVLEKPNVAFDIKAIDPDPSIKSYVEQQLALLKTNEAELNKQVFGLLVMNRFLPQTNSGTASIVNTGYLGGTAANTVSEFLSSQLSNYISNLLDYASVKNLDINIGYRQYDQIVNQQGNTQGITDTRRELQLALEQRLLNNRLIINAGGNLDFGSNNINDNGTGTQSGSRSVIPTGDFQIEYLLTKDGVWRAKAFNRTNYDYFNSRNNNRTGIGLSYRKEFDKASDLFPSRKKKKKKPETKPQATAPERKEE